MLKRHVPLIAVFLAAYVSRASAAPTRSTSQIDQDIRAVDAQIHARNYPDSVKYNPLYRAQMGREYGPLYQQLIDLRQEYASAMPRAAVNLRHLSAMNVARLAFWGNDAAQARVDAAAGDANPAMATEGKLGQALIAWWNAFGDADAQARAFDAVDVMAKASPTNASVADALHLMLVTTPTSVSLGQRMTATLCKTLSKTEIGREYAATPNRLEIPLVVEGVQLNGRSFKSTVWAGKVVLVDFWATWCPPCREEIPHVAKAYQQYHDQGLEIVSVSSDSDRNDLATFLQQHPEMPWPELFHAGTDWHPLTKKFGINSIPTIYLIDRNGILRTMEALHDMDRMIPDLLAEPYTPAPTTTATDHVHINPLIAHPIGSPSASTYAP